MRTVLCAAVFLASVNDGFASGALWCSVDDAKVAFQLDAGVTRGLGGPTFNFRGDLEIKDRPAADSLRKTEFEAKDSYRSVELTILTKAKDEGTYDGRYTLAVYDGTAGVDSDPVELKGDVSCGAE